MLTALRRRPGRPAAAHFRHVRRQIAAISDDPRLAARPGSASMLLTETQRKFPISRSTRPGRLDSCAVRIPRSGVPIGKGL